MKVIKRVKNGLGLLLLSSLCVANSVAQPFNGFRGPNRNGIYPETGLLKVWPENGPDLLWETMDAGKGYSSPVIYENRIYLTGMNEDEDKEIFSAYTIDGKKIYEIVYGEPWSKSYPETRTTPTIKDGKAFLVSGSGEVLCINLADGNIVWKVSAGQTYGAKEGYWGTAECPLVFDNKVIYTPAGDQTTMVAFNTENGELLWKTKTLNSYGCYVSPILITHNGKKQIVGTTANHVIGVNPDNGNMEWIFDQWGRPAPTGGLGGEPGSSTYVPLNNAINMPIYNNGRLFFSQGYNIGAYMIEINDDATAATLVWNNPDLDTHHGAQVLVNGVIYGSNQISNSDGNWMAVDWNTGETKYDNAWGGGRSKGSIVSADGMIYCYDERRGTVGLIKPGTDKFDVVSQFRITKGEGPHWAHPVIKDGILYIRHGNALMAYKVK